MPPLRSIAAATVTLFGMVLSVSCGGEEFALAPDAAGNGSRDSSTAAPDGGGDARGAATAFCQSLSAYYARCQLTADCYRTNLMNCGAESYALSDVARRAFLDCQSSVPCTQGSDAIRQSCFSAALATATPTAAQFKLASDYCAACATSGTTCNTATFFKEGITTAGDGPGFLALLYNDTIATSIDRQCFSTGVVGCDASFRICEAYVVQAQVAGDACKDAGP
jgi:hypothetical protein